MLPKPIVMKNFIDDYLADKAQTIADAIESAGRMKWCETIDENVIYSQIESAEFRLYQEMVCF